VWVDLEHEVIGGRGLADERRGIPSSARSAAAATASGKRPLLLAQKLPPLLGRELPGSPRACEPEHLGERPARLAVVEADD